MKRSDLPRHSTSTYVLHRWKTVYVSVPKVACTSLKWLVADLQGEDPKHFERGLNRETGRAMTVHIRDRWQHTPRLSELDDAALAEIAPDNGWFVFGVVRHPAGRLWSGWQSKLLLQEPRFQDLYPDGPWPRLPRTTDEVVEDFHEFVRALTRPEAPVTVAEDRHFLAQAPMLRTDAIDYSRIYRTEEIGRLMVDLEAHLTPLGLDQMPTLRRNNETPLKPTPEMFVPDILELVTKHYAIDYEHFDYPPMPTGLTDGYTDDQLAEIGRLVERAERIHDLYRLTMRCRSGRRAALEEVERLKLELAQRSARGPLQRVRSTVGRALRRR